MKRVTNFLTGLIFGALLGGMITLLLTPSSGDELRTQLQARAQSIQDEVKTAAAERRAELEEQLSNLRKPA
ncbi:MAG: YtxH domain-containing protein [Chloroflexi bacterium]|jgi:gas vesicle protein|nr:YtxH domain-containing protein [Chloroflexota bacterium]